MQFPDEVRGRVCEPPVVLGFGRAHGSGEAFFAGRQCEKSIIDVGGRSCEEGNKVFVTGNGWSEAIGRHDSGEADAVV